MRITWSFTRILASMGICGLAAALALMPSAAFAADDMPNGSSGIIPGVFAGLILAALIGYALWIYAEPLVRSRDRPFGRVLLGLLILLALKTLALGIFTGYALDLGTFQAWAMRMASVGPARMYVTGYFVDY